MTLDPGTSAAGQLCMVIVTVSMSVLESTTQDRLIDEATYARGSAS